MVKFYLSLPLHEVFLGSVLGNPLSIDIADGKTEMNDVRIHDLLVFLVNESNLDIEVSFLVEGLRK